MISRATSLEMLFNKSKFDIIGIQEGRMKGDQLISGIFYNMFVAGAAANGSYGSQIWISHSLPHTVQSSLVVSCRVIVLSIKVHGRDRILHCISAHAPHSGRVSEACTFWFDLLRVVKNLRCKSKGSEFLLLVDANANVGTVASASIGLCSPEAESVCGEMFRHFLEAACLLASSTFFPIEYTWTGSRGHRSKIDYIATSTNVHDRIVECYRDDDIDLSLGMREDHSVVVTVFDAMALGDRGKNNPSKSTFIFDRDGVSDPWKCDYFKELMWRVELPKDGDISDRAQALQMHLKSAAVTAFGKPPKRPRQNWVRPNTWYVIQLNAPLRRLSHQCYSCIRGATKAIYFYVWCSLRPMEYLPTSFSLKPRRPSGWLAIARESSFRAALRTLHRCDAVLYSSIALVKMSTSRLAIADKLYYYHELAYQAALASVNGNMSKSFGIVNSLKGYQQRPMKAVRLKCGRLSTNESERQLRWQDYFCQLLCGRILSNPQLLKSSSFNPIKEHDVIIPVSRTQKSLNALGIHRAAGPDEIPAILLKAGGCAVAVLVNQIQNEILEFEEWPIAWKGGRFVDLWKRKGDARECENSRGLQISDHMAKATVDIFKEECAEQVQKNLPEEQLGGVSGGGTDLANHIIRSLQAYAKQMGWCCFTLFIDLVAAYDSAIREIVFDVPHDWAGSVPDYLTSLGLKPHLVEAVTELLESEGSVMHASGVSPKVERIINSLHTRAWSRYGNLESVVQSVVGGRQGCKLGGLVFAATHGRVMKEVRSRMRESNIVLKLFHKQDDAVWDAGEPDKLAREAPDEWHEVETVEAAFVDDEAFVLMAPTCKKMDDIIDTVTEIITSTFYKYGLTINWKPGKTEAMLRYRHKHSAKALDHRRLPSGKIAIKLPPSCGDNLLNVVDKYKHLGGMVTVTGNMTPETEHRACSALQAFTPLAMRIFGSLYVPTCLKMSFVQTLVYSRLLFNAHVWEVTPKVIAKLNTVQSRILRRVCGEMRYSATSSTLSDRDVRGSLNAMSIDCLIQRARLKYIVRVQASRCRPLLALLRSRPMGKPLPWIQHICDDFNSLYRFVPKVRDVLPGPSTPGAIKAWYHFMQQKPESWYALVDQLRYIDSCIDVVKVSGSLESVVSAFVCCDCDSSFASNKALLCHRRKRHGYRDPVRLFLNADGVCPVCRTCFNSRLRTMAHVNDRRNQTCKTLLLSGEFPQLPEELATELDEFDRNACKEARRQGHSHPIAVQSARKANGKRVGYVTK